MAARSSSTRRATGNYTDYICDEIVPFIDANYPTDGRSQRRAVTGHSSGGYGALVLPMLRPDAFGGAGRTAPDTLFEACYLRDFAKVVRALRDRTTAPTRRCSRQQFAAPTRFDWGRWGEALNTYAMAAAYSPDPDHPGEGAVAVRHRAPGC